MLDFAPSEELVVHPAKNQQATFQQNLSDVFDVVKTQTTVPVICSYKPHNCMSAHHGDTEQWIRASQKPLVAVKVQ
jgi:hypothetical protein